MSTTTTKLGLVKPEMTDAADITAMNGNWDKIDTKLDEKANTSDLPNITKNIADTTGDIITTHLTVGRRYGAMYGNKSFVVGYGAAENEGAVSIGGIEDGGNIYPNKAQAKASAVIGGEQNVASGSYDVIIGGSLNTVSGGNSAIIGGGTNIVSGALSVLIGGYGNEANGYNSVVIGGQNNISLAHQVKTGHYAKGGTAGTESGTTGDAFTIGNGTSSARANCFRVDYAGNVYGLSSFKGTGADYAEYFEWLDGNTDSIDRRGMFVTLDGEKIRIANDTDDYILGVVSALPSICGDTQSEVWQGMYLKDVYGAYLIDDDGNMILNPEYDDKNEYISREHRKEWSAVGMLGKLVVRDDGTCQVNEYCEVSKNGVATSSETGYRVLSRIDETHVKILFR